MNKFGALIAGMVCALSLVGCESMSNDIRYVIETERDQSLFKVQEVEPEDPTETVKCEVCGIEVPKDETKILLDMDKAEYIRYCKDCVPEEENTVTCVVCGKTIDENDAIFSNEKYACSDECVWALDRLNTEPDKESSDNGYRGDAPDEPIIYEYEPEPFLTVHDYTFYWTDEGTKYHSTRDCRLLQNSDHIHAGTVDDIVKDGFCKECCGDQYKLD